MCGICGIAEREGRPVDETSLDRMMAAMVHRGPDDAGKAMCGSVGLGFRRLAILDLEQGHQPMANEDGTIWTLVNGEIYNYRELRRELLDRGHRLHSHCDAEVVAHLYEEGGMDFVHRLRGMFAVAVYDRRREDLYLVRDHFGIKPLYYAQADGRLLFASEVRSILASGTVRPAVDPQSLWHYLSFQYVPDPATMFRGISKLAPAHYLHWHDGAIRTVRYWRYEFRPDPSIPLPEVAQAVREGLRESVNRHTASDVPLGAYLSSGIDSSAVVALLRERGPLDTFSVGFSGDHGQVNELAQAEATARLLDTRHHPVWVSARRYQECWPRIVASQEDPIADPSAPALYFLAEAAKPHVTVVLSGEGADELFGGYPIYAEPHALRAFEHLSDPMRRALGDAARHLPAGMKGRGFLERGSLPLRRRYLGNAKMFSEEEKRVLMREAAPATGWESSHDLLAPLYDATEGMDDVTRMQTVDGHTWLPGDILMKADKMAMAHSVELRVPFLDREVFRIASAIPASYRISHGTTKYVLRQALKGILPPHLVNRPKLGFPVPIRHWLRHEMRDFAYDVIRSSSGEFLDRGYLEQLLGKASRHVVNRDRKLWTVLTFLLWHREFIEQRQAAEDRMPAVVGQQP